MSRQGRSPKPKSAPAAAWRIAVAVIALLAVLALPALSWGKPAPVLTGARPGLLLAPTNSDLGFKPNVNGFSFDNFGNEIEVDEDTVKVVNLTPDTMYQMFGAKAGSKGSGGKVTLLPAARVWMEQQNAEMDGGHCEGMAVTSMLLYTGQGGMDVKKMGADNAYALKVSNTTLENSIARWYTTQNTDPTSSSVIQDTPTEILQLLNGMSKTGETYTLGVAKRDRSGGHAVTPYKVVNDGNGKYRVMVYDSNWPGQERAVNVDTKKDTWNYVTSENPSKPTETYEGDADSQTLELTPTSKRLVQQVAPFAKAAPAKSGGPATASLVSVAPGGESYNQLYLQGKGNLLITDEAGRQMGYSGAAFVHDIPGARYSMTNALGPDGTSPEPLYWLPTNMTAQVSIDGSTLQKESPTKLTMIGPGFAVGVGGITLDPGQKDTVIFDPADQAVSYETDKTESPSFVVAADQVNGASYYFKVQGTEMQGGGTITAMLDTKDKALLINTEKLKNQGDFNLVMTRVTGSEEEEITAEHIKLPAGAIIYTEYGEWKGPGDKVQFGVDINGDGKIEDVYESETTGTGGGMPYYVWIIIAVVVVLALCLVIFIVMRRRSKKGGGGTEVAATTDI
jgi:hypothetical protein